MFVKPTVAAVISVLALMSLTGSHAAPSTSPLHLTKRASSDSAMYTASVELLSSMLASYIALVCLRTLFMVYLWYAITMCFVLSVTPTSSLSIMSCCLSVPPVWLRTQSGHSSVPVGSTPVCPLFPSWHDDNRGGGKQQCSTAACGSYSYWSMRMGEWQLPSALFLTLILYIHSHAIWHVSMHNYNKVSTVAYVCAIRLSVYWSISADDNYSKWSSLCPAVEDIAR